MLATHNFHKANVTTLKRPLKRFWLNRRSNFLIQCKQTAELPSHKSVRVTLHIPYRCYFGQSMAVVGSAECLGKWNADKAIVMNWSTGDIWLAEFDVGGVPGDHLHLEYKYIVRGGDGHIIRWKPGSNYILDLTLPNMPAVQIFVDDSWDQTTKEVDVRKGPTSSSYRDAGTQEIEAPGEVALVKPQSITREIQANERLLVSVANTAIKDLQYELENHNALISNAKDPAALEIIEADRKMAAIMNKAVSLHRAVRAVEACPVFPVKDVDAPSV